MQSRAIPIRVIAYRCIKNTPEYYLQFALIQLVGGIRDNVHRSDTETPADYAAVVQGTSGMKMIDGV
jgi:hypothetical protein